MRHKGKGRCCMHHHAQTGCQDGQAPRHSQAAAHLLRGPLRCKYHANFQRLPLSTDFFVIWEALYVEEVRLAWAPLASCTASHDRSGIALMKERRLIHMEGAPSYFHQPKPCALCHA